MINIALTNLGKYNEGDLIFKWLELPATQQEIDDCLEAIGIDYEEYEKYFITDYESDIQGLKIGEYENLDTLNEIAESFANLDEHNKEKIEAYIECENLPHTWEDWEEIISRLDNMTLYTDCHNFTDLAYHLIDDRGTLEIPEHLQDYFDYEKYGYDLKCSGDFTETSKGMFEY